MYSCVPVCSAIVVVVVVVVVAVVVVIAVVVTAVVVVVVVVVVAREINHKNINNNTYIFHSIFRSHSQGTFPLSNNNNSHS